MKRQRRRHRSKEDPNLTANRLLFGAVDFADLADVYATARPGFKKGNPLVLTFVLALSLELALKAVLRKDGATEKTLRHRFGHDVEAAYRVVGKAHSPSRLTRTPSRARVLKLLRLYYTEKYLEYTPLGPYEIPKPYVLRGMVLEAIRFGFDHVFGAGASRKMRDAKGVRMGAPRAAYGNTSRREMRKRERLLFEKLAGDITDG